MWGKSVDRNEKRGNNTMRKLNLYSFKRFSDLQRKVKELDESIAIINIEQITGKFFLYTIEVNNE